MSERSRPEKIMTFAGIIILVSLFFQFFFDVSFDWNLIFFFVVDGDAVKVP